MKPPKPYEVFRPTLLAEANPDVDYLQAIQDFAAQRPVVTCPPRLPHS
jgi:hypothetical protein